MKTRQPWKIRIETPSDSQRAHTALSAPLVFGRVFADLMLQIRHSSERGWFDAAIVPFGPLPLSPAAKVLHYGQEIFEGLKAYRWRENPAADCPDDGSDQGFARRSNGEVALFRPELNARRLNASARRMCLPEIPEALQLDALERFVDAVRDWVPDQPGSSLYLRPAIIGTEDALGIGPSASHLYFVIASPVGAYFPRGFKPISIYVEPQEVRASPGGVGAAKTGGNYAAALLAQERARTAGYDQVLWLDAIEHRFIEELSGMNVFVVRGGRLLTPPLEGTILPGITRRSMLEIAPDLGLDAREQHLPIDDIVRGIRTGYVSEIFAVGTAAVITPISVLGHAGARLTVGKGEPGAVATRLHRAITDIQYGRAEDRHGWMRIVPRRPKETTVDVPHRPARPVSDRAIVS